MATVEARTPQEQLRQMLHIWDGVMRHPLWYELVVPDIKQWRTKVPLTPETRHLYDTLDEFIEGKLAKGEIALATSGPNFDQLRAPVEQIDTFIIHHSA